MNVSDETQIRQATEADVETIVDFRCEMFRDMGWTDEERLAELAPLYEAYVRAHMLEGDFAAWVAEQSDGRRVGVVGVLWERVPPTVRNLHGRQAYILGLFVASNLRRRGIARRLAEVALDYARSNGADVVSLHASHEGRGLYEELGFIESPEMRLFTDPASAAWVMPHAACEDAD